MPLRKYVTARSLGRTSACFAHHIVAQNSMDERVSEALQRKDADQEAIIKAIRRV